MYIIHIGPNSKPIILRYQSYSDVYVDVYVDVDVYVYVDVNLDVDVDADSHLDGYASDDTDADADAIINTNTNMDSCKHSLTYSWLTILENKSYYIIKCTRTCLSTHTLEYPCFTSSILAQV